MALPFFCALRQALKCLCDSRRLWLVICFEALKGQSTDHIYIITRQNDVCITHLSEIWLFSSGSLTTRSISSFNFFMKWSEVAQSCLTLCDPIDWGLPGSSVHGIFQAIVLEWIAISFSRGSSHPRARTWAFGSINMNEAVGGDGIPVELFQILKDDAMNVLYSISRKFGKLSSGHMTGKVNFHSNPQNEQCQRMFKLLHNCSHFIC